MKPGARLALLAALTVPLAAAQAQTSATPNITELLRRLDAQDQRIKALEHKLEEQQLQEQQQAQASAAAPAAPAAPAPAGAAPGGGASARTGEGAVADSTPHAPATSNTATPATARRAGSHQLAVRSSDGSNVIRLRGNLQVDGRFYSDEVTAQTRDTFLLRKVRPYVEGTLDDIYDFRLMPDFGGGKAVVTDAYVAGRFKPWFTVQAGKFKAPVGLERLQPDHLNRFMELGLPSDLVPNRDLGIQLGGNLAGGALSYAIGYFDGVPDGSSTDTNSTPDADTDGRRDVDARLFSQPFRASGNPYLRGLGLGVAGTYVNATGNATNTLLASYKTAGAQNFFSYRTGTSATYADGRRMRISPQFFYFGGSLGVLGEYVRSEQDVSRQTSASLLRSGQIDNSAWQVLVSYFLTGEQASYNSVTPKSTFRPGGSGWGAWEIAARFEELKIDDAAFVGGAASFADPDTSPRKATAFGVGLNWYLSEYVKLVFNYEHTMFDGGAPGGADRPSENALLTRFALAF